MEMYIRPFLASFLASMTCLAILVSLSKGKERPAWRKRLGGLAVFAGFILALFASPELIISPELTKILVLGLLVVIFGLWDDLKRLDWKGQLAFQSAVALALFWLGIRIGYVTDPVGGMLAFGFWGSLTIGTLWVLIIFNAMNWLDGVDGLSGGVTLISALTVFLLSFKPQVNQPPVGIVMMALSGGVLAFLVVNFYPGRIWAGTSGSLFFGFILAAVAIFAGAKIATALLVMTVPLVDLGWVIFRRWRDGTSIFRGDRRHLHHRLLDHGWSPIRICLLFYGLTAVFAVLALLTESFGKIFSIVLAYLLAGLIVVHFSADPGSSGPSHGKTA